MHLFLDLINLMEWKEYINGNKFGCIDLFAIYKGQKVLILLYQSIKGEKMAKGITFKIPDEFHIRLKIVLVKKDLRLTKLVEDLLRNWVDENEEE